MKDLDKDEKTKKVIGDAVVTSEDNDEIKEDNDNKHNGQSTNFNYQQGGYYHSVDNNKDNKNPFWIVVIVLIVVVVSGILWFLVLSNVSHKTNAGDKKESTTNNDVELNYTETSKASEGVYITDVSEIVENVMPSIVAITSKTLVSSGQFGPSFFGYGKEQYSTGAGSGIIVSKTDNELMILTNNHVIEGAESLSVQFINNKSVDAKVKGSSASCDVAIITVNLADLDKETVNSIKIATMGKSEDLKVGNGVIAIGNALGYGQSVTTGVVSALNREVTIDNNTMNMIQIDAAINGGNSGGALLNEKGEVVGINSAKYSSNAYSSSASIEGMGFAIPITDVSELITRLMNGENLTDKERGYLGVSGYVITEAYSEAYSLPQGFYISSIVEGSGADKAKLEIGNIITAINGKSVGQFSDISKILEMKKAHEEVTLKVKYISGREYKEKEVKLTLSSYDEVNKG